MSKKPALHRPSLLSLSIASAIGMVATGGYTPATQAQEGASAEEIVITGSRIVRRDFQSNSPIVTVDSDDFEAQTGLNFESYLNQLPSFNPASTPTTTQGDVQPSAINSVGIASVSLRGFGPNRSLVLVDGRRPVPINALMVTDINAIPSALIERVEVISGGASAVYGADAVGGVTNFILKDNFEGVEIDAQYGVSEVGDGEESRVSGVFGSNFDNGRGNVTIGLERYKRRSALEKERDFYTDSWSDPSVASDDLFLFGYNGYNSGFAPPNPGTLNAIMSDSPESTGVQAPGAGLVQGFRFNRDGSLFTTAGDNLAEFNGTIDNREVAVQRSIDGTQPAGSGAIAENVKWNNQQALVSAPQDRYSFFADGSYDLTDDVTVFARGTWAESKTETLLLPTNASYGWEATIPFNPETDSPIDPSLDYTNPDMVQQVLANPGQYANPNFIETGESGAQHPVPAELAAALLSRPAAGPFGTDAQGTGWIMETYPDEGFPQRQTENTNTVWQLETGLNINLPFRDWSAELYYSHGESNTYTRAQGNNSLQRWRTMVQQPDYGRGAEITGNQNGADPGFGAAEVTCTSGFYDNIFLDEPASDDCSFAVEAPLQSRTQHQQDIFELNLQGAVVDLPAGEVRAAAGFQWRENAAQYYPDLLQSTRSTEDQVIGVYPTAAMDAETSVKDYYGELLVPVLSGLPFMDYLELELGARYSDYEHTDEETTFKTLLNWTVNDRVRLRGGFNRATRAPNLGELFLNEQEVFIIGGANFGDPCGLASSAPFSAAGAEGAPDQNAAAGLAPGQTQTGANSAYMICQAQMGAGADTFYEPGSDASGQAPGFDTSWRLQEGNPDLESETADTWTFGAVVTSPFDNPWLAGITASFDWWKVDIEDAIQLYSVDYARYLCYGAATVSNMEEAQAQANSQACQNVDRSVADGGSTTVKTSYDNQATIETSGIDIAVNWSAQLQDLGFGVPGGVGVNMQATWLDYYETKQSPLDFDVVTDWKGSLGPTLTGTNAGAYDYRIFTNFSYFYDNWSVNLRWRHLPEVVTADYAQQQAVIENNAAVAGGSEGIVLGYTPSTAIEADSYNIFDLSFNWSINNTLTLRGGVNNLFDEDPSITGATAGYEPGTDLQAVCEGAVAGCVPPNDFSLASSGAGSTNSGYYDTIGRRYFLGLEARF